MFLRTDKSLELRAACARATVYVLHPSLLHAAPILFCEWENLTVISERWFFGHYIAI